MIWEIFSFFLTNEEPFLEFNTNILETNAINLLILISLLFYGNQITIQPDLKKRQKDISQIIENVQKDVVDSSNFYSLVEKSSMQIRFWLYSWREIFQKEKLDFVNSQYKIVKTGLLETFQSINNLIKNSEKKSFLNLKRYILLLTASRLLRKFLNLTRYEKSMVIETIITRLGGENL